MIHPLNLLLHKDTKWNSNSDCEKAFTEAKEALVSSTVLTHYDRDLPLTLAEDASAYGIGAVISHVIPDGSEHPIAFASRTLTSSVQNYAQLEKEALSLIFGVKKFHQYLYGRRFTLITDHKPLLTILGPKKGIPSLAAARYDIKFKDTLSHANADSLSRLITSLKFLQITMQLVLTAFTAAVDEFGLPSRGGENVFASQYYVNIMLQHPERGTVS